MSNPIQPIEVFELASDADTTKTVTTASDSKQAVRESANFPELATTANSVYFRSYSRKLPDGKRENWYQSTLRVAEYLKEVGKLTEEEFELILDQQLQCKSLFSGRLNWVGGSAWRRKPENVYGAYNCNSTNIKDIESFGLLMNLAMQGVGTGAVLEPKHIEQLPTVVNSLNVTIKSEIGTVSKDKRADQTSCHIDDNVISIHVGDSRQGWVDSYTRMLKLATNKNLPRELEVHVYLGNVRDKGEDLKGFGGVANPIKLPELYGKVAAITNKAVGRQLTSVECCLLIDNAAIVVVAGNIRRSAGIKQFIDTDKEASTAKDNLWQQSEDGKWFIDPERDALRMSNHTRVFHKKPTLEEITQSVTKQYYSGEGAIQFAPEAIARANADLLDTEGKRQEFIRQYCEHESMGFAYLQRMARYKGVYLGIEEIEHRLNRYGLNPCGEILGIDFFCNLGEIHLNMIDPFSLDEQRQAFKAAAISVCTLLHDKFPNQRYQYSRDIDPIVGVSFTGLFDFFVKLFGVEWLKWWEAGRPKVFECNQLSVSPKLADLVVSLGLNLYIDFIKRGVGFDATFNIAQMFTWIEQAYLNYWKEIVQNEVEAYCTKHGLRIPNRCTTVQPAGCLDKTAIRVFDQGLMYLDELVAPGSGDRQGLDLSVRNGVVADKAIANQPMNLVKVTLKNGRVLRMTPNHRLSIGGKWVRADEMQVGTKIDFSIGEYRKTEDALLLPINPEHYTREYRVATVGHGRGLLTQTIAAPNQLSPKLAYFLGCIFGNGHISAKPKRVRFSFGSNMMATVEKLQSVGQELFGISGVITDEKTKVELCFASGQLVDWLINNNLSKGEKSADLDRIPLPVRRSSLETVLSFFCGLIDTDGCVRTKGSLSIDSASEEFIRNLQQLGEAVGLCFSVFHNTQGQNLQGQKDMWGLCLSRMLSTSYARNFLNTNSIKCQNRPLPAPKTFYDIKYYQIAKIEFETVPDYSFDISVDGVDDDDAWYWQGGLKSHNSKSLLTGASSGWSMPKAARYIRRITFDRDNPIALACRDYGYSIIPGQSDKDENGNLLNDPFDPRCTEWLVEMPCQTVWADLPGCDQIDISRFSVAAQFDFCMQVQRYYTTHNTSATLELRENEIPILSDLIYNSIQNDEGYISAALLARFDSLETFPRLPFEPIDQETYNKLYEEVLNRRKSDDFIALLAQYDKKAVDAFNQGAAGCDSDKCLMPEKKPD